MQIDRVSMAVGGVKKKKCGPAGPVSLTITSLPGFRSAGSLLLQQCSVAADARLALIALHPPPRSFQQALSDGGPALSPGRPVEAREAMCRLAALGLSSAGVSHHDPCPLGAAAGEGGVVQAWRGLAAAHLPARPTTHATAAGPAAGGNWCRQGRAAAGVWRPDADASRLGSVACLLGTSWPANSAGAWLRCDATGHVGSRLPGCAAPADRRR